MADKLFFGEMDKKSKLIKKTPKPTGNTGGKKGSRLSRHVKEFNAKSAPAAYDRNPLGF